MSIYSFPMVSWLEVLTLILLIAALIFLCKGKRKICIWIISILLVLRIIGNWNMWFGVFIFIRGLFG